MVLPKHQNIILYEKLVKCTENFALVRIMHHTSFLFIFKFGRPEVLFTKIIDDIQQLHIFAKSSILDVWLGCEYVSVHFPIDIQT